MQGTFASLIKKNTSVVKQPDFFNERTKIIFTYGPPLILKNIILYLCTISYSTYITKIAVHHIYRRRFGEQLLIYTLYRVSNNIIDDRIFAFYRLEDE